MNLPGAPWRLNVSLADFPRERKVKGAPLPCLAFHPDMATVGFDDFFADCEPKSCSPVIRILLPGNLAMKVKNVVQLLPRNADTGVLNRDDGSNSFLCARGHFDLSAIVGEFESVAQKITQHLANALPIERQPWHVAADLAFQRDSSFIGLEGIVEQIFMDQGRKIDGCLDELEFAGLDLREVEKIADMVDQAPAVVFNLPQPSAL